MKKVFLFLTLVTLLVPAGYAITPATGGSHSSYTTSLHPAASYAAWEWSTSGTVFTNGDWTFGQVFTVSSPLTVDYLGYYNQASDGFGPMVDQHPVSIWDSNGNLIASSTINAASGTTSTHFLYNPISPVILGAGTYEITGVSGVDNYAYGDTGWTLYAPVTYDGYNYCLSCGDVFTGLGTTDLGIGDAFWGPNFGWTPSSTTPEPGSLILLGTGILGLAGTMRRKLF